jgi:hypothetical protein
MAVAFWSTAHISNIRTQVLRRSIANTLHGTRHHRECSQPCIPWSCRLEHHKLNSGSRPRKTNSRPERTLLDCGDDVPCCATVICSQAGSPFVQPLRRRKRSASAIVNKPSIHRLANGRRGSLTPMMLLGMLTPAEGGLWIGRATRDLGGRVSYSGVLICIDGQPSNQGRRARGMGGHTTSSSALRKCRQRHRDVTSSVPLPGIISKGIEIVREGNPKSSL